LAYRNYIILTEALLTRSFQSTSCNHVLITLNILMSYVSAFNVHALDVTAPAWRYLGDVYCLQ